MIAPLFDASSATLTIGVAVLLGVAFGWALESAGLGSARKLAGQFDFSDLTVFKVMFSAIVTAMLGLFWLSRLGFLDLRRVYMPATFLAPQAVGGVVFGIGFAIAGLCPGTSCVAAASGRIDGFLVMLGMGGGVLMAGLLLFRINEFYNSTARGALTLPALFHLSPALTVAAVGVSGVGALVLARRFERSGKVLAEASQMQLHGELRGWPATSPRSVTRVAAVVALAGAVGAPLVGRADPASALDVAGIAARVERQDDQVAPLQLAQWIREAKSGLRIIDLRDQAAFAAYHLPRSERSSLTAVMTRPFTPSDSVVLLSEDGTRAAQTWVLLKGRGVRHVAYLRGGVTGWIAEVLNPQQAAHASPEQRASFAVRAELSRYFGGVPRAGASSTEPRSSPSAALLRRRGC